MHTRRSQSPTKHLFHHIPSLDPQKNNSRTPNSTSKLGDGGQAVVSNPAAPHHPHRPSHISVGWRESSAASLLRQKGETQERLKSPGFLFSCAPGEGKKCSRHEQDSNLCGETPLDFESNALTTRPSQPQMCNMFLGAAHIFESVCSPDPDSPSLASPASLHPKQRATGNGRGGWRSGSPELTVVCPPTLYPVLGS